MTHLNITILGRVQEVLFRQSTKEVADKLNIRGSVKNLPNGSVFIEAEGEKGNLDKFIEWCHDGPELASVEKVEVKQASLNYFKDFVIK